MNRDHDNGARLRAYAITIDGHTTRLPDLDDPVRPPDFIQLTGQFANLNQTTRELTDLVLRLNATSSFDRRPMELWRLTRATAALATGTGSIGRALAELAFLTDTHPHRNQPDTADARAASQGVFEDALAEAHIDLREGSTDLHRLANDLDPPRITAALTRTTTLTTPPPQQPAPRRRSPGTARPPNPLTHLKDHPHMPHDDHTGARLRSFATAIGSHITRLPDPDINDPVHTPDFAEMTRQAGELTDLAKELAGYLLHTDSRIPLYGETDERWQLSSALSDLLTAAGHVSQTATQLAHLTKIHTTPGQPDFEHELESTLSIAANALYNARFTLRQSAAELHRLANHRDHPRNPHALSRTTTASRAPSDFDRSPATTPPPVPRTARSL